MTIKEYKTMSLIKYEQIVPTLGYVRNDSCYKRNEKKMIKMEVAILFSLLLAICPLCITFALKSNHVETSSFIDENSESNAYLLLPWDQRPVNEKYTRFINNKVELLNFHQRLVKSEYVGNLICSTVLEGFDDIERVSHYINALVYSINGIDSDICVAIKYDGFDDYYFFMNWDVENLNLGSFDDFNGRYSFLRYLKMDDSNICYRYIFDHEDYINYYKDYDSAFCLKTIFDEAKNKEISFRDTRAVYWPQIYFTLDFEFLTDEAPLVKDAYKMDCTLNESNYLCINYGNPCVIHLENDIFSKIKYYLDAYFDYCI